MQSETFSRYLCLELDRIPDVINAEAIAVDRAMFLATHTPFTDIAVERAPQALEQIDEIGLLNSLIDAARQDEHVFMVVKGVQGAGKSHLIRWLKERYVGHQNFIEHGRQSDVILLIERANASLRGTLDQLISSGVFDQATSKQQLDRLRNASFTLSDEQLGNLLLSNLQIGTLDETLPDGSMAPRRIQRPAQEFLLDKHVRNQLMLAGGPIDRIRRFLTDGRGGGLGFNDFPEFVADDLAFPLSVRREITNNGYQGAKSLADDLNDRDTTRVQVAAYFNKLLPVAIQRTTALSGDDLRTIFFDLRRRLQEEGRSLVLLIEDVTSFTGIDSALMDVLITQHTGEGNRNLCRMTSVIGVTDSFFADRIPANIKDRVTHQVALSAGSARVSQVSTPVAVAQLSSRYLNVLRLKPGELETWAEHGAEVADIPNVCARCPFQPTCHATFGAVPLDSDPDGIGVGLYPFNERALWTMFKALDPNRVAPTPRSLLRSVIQYVLQSHAHRIIEGTFPPPPDQLGIEFTVPQLANPLQLRAIEQQAGPQAKSVETLVRVWGNRTFDASEDANGKRVADLPGAALTAFGLPAISGEGSTNPKPGALPRPEPGPGEHPNPVQPGAPPPPHPTPSKSADVHQTRIETWRQGGKLLSNNEFATWVSSFFADAIDWERHRIPIALVQERLQPGLIVFEGQASTSNRVDQLRFPRTGEVADALQALLVLRSSAPDTDIAAIGGAIARLSSWRRREEARIVRFVRQPDQNTPEPIPLVRAVMQNSVALAALRGAIPPSAFDSAPEVLVKLIEDHVADKSSQPTDREWEAELTELKARYRESWKSVTDRRWRLLKPTEMQARLRLVLGVERRGATSDGSGFIDAATALDELAAMRANNWNLRTWEASQEGWAPTWMYVASSWQFLERYFTAGVTEGLESLMDARACLEKAIGNTDARTVVEEIRKTLDLLETLQKPHRLESTKQIRPEDIRLARGRFEQAATTTGDVRLGAVLASRQPSVSDVLGVVRQVESFADFVERELDKAKDELRGQGALGEAESLEVKEVLATYDHLIAKLAHASTVGERTLS